MSKCHFGPSEKMFQAPSLSWRKAFVQQLLCMYPTVKRRMGWVVFVLTAYIFCFNIKKMGQLQYKSQKLYNMDIIHT